MKHYLNFKWASDAGHFENYNKEKGENEKFTLNEIAVTNVCYTVKGWDEVSGSAIYSNDITDFRGEEFTVRSKWGELVKWLYWAIKEDILWAGGKLHIKVEGIQDWEEVVITLKWLNFFQLSETLKTINIKTEFLKFEWTEDDKKWAVKFKKTIFGKGWKTKPEDYVVAEAISESDIPF